MAFGFNFGGSASNASTQTTSNSQSETMVQTPSTPTPSKEDIELQSQLKESKQTVDFSNFLLDNESISREKSNSSPQSQQDLLLAKEEENKRMDAFFNSKQYNNLTSDLYSKLQEGDVDSFNEALSSSLRNVYKDSMVSASKLIDARFNSIDDIISKRLESQSKSSTLMSTIKARIPVAQNPKFTQMVIGQVKNNISDGMTEDKAIAAVRAMFSDLQLEITPKSEKSRTIDEFDELFK